MRPAILCHLKKGTLIDTNPGFVDTFNWLVDFCNNLQGDKDLNRKRHISVNRSKDDHPVIEFDGEAGGGSADALDMVSVNRTPPAEEGGESEAAGRTQIYNFHSPSASDESPTAIGEDLERSAGQSAATDKIIVRTADGALKYKSIGRLQTAITIGPFHPTFGSDGETLASLEYCYYQVGGFTFQLPDQTPPITDGIICLRVAVASSGVSASLVGYTSLANLAIAQQTLTTTIVPLFEVAGGKIIVDMRRMPTTGVIERFS